jgi:hypothetical protein
MPGSDHVEYVTKDGISYQGRPKPADSPEFALLWTLIDPLPEKEMIQDQPLTDEIVSVGGSLMHCIAVHQGTEPHSTSPEPPPAKFCFQQDKPMLRISSPDGAGRQVTYNRIFLFQQRYIAGEVHYSVNDKLLLRANVEVLENFQSIDSGMFTPPSAVTRLTPKKIVLDSKVVEQYRIKSASPQYIWEDNRFNLEGTVVLDATVGFGRTRWPG